MSDVAPSADNDSQLAPPPEPAITLAPPTPANRPAEATALAVRLWCGLVFLVCGGMLTVGFLLTPSPDGFGKKQGLFGMPACGFYTTTGYPCPTCGCTTAVSHFAHGHLVASLATQPFGFAVALVASIAAMLAAAGLITGKWHGPSMFILNWYWRMWVFGGIAILALGWLYKIILVKMS